MKIPNIEKQRREYCDPRFTDRYFRMIGIGWGTLLKPTLNDRQAIEEHLAAEAEPEPELWAYDPDDEVFDNVEEFDHLAESYRLERELFYDYAL